MEDFRKSIDQIDDQISKLLAERFKLAHDVGEYKQQKALPVLQSGREQEIIEKIKKISAASGVDSVPIEKVYETILSESRKIQQELKDY